MFVNFDLRPQPDVQTAGIAVDIGDGVIPRIGETVTVAEPHRHRYEVIDVVHTLSSVEAENDGDLSVTVVCEFRGATESPLGAQS